MRRCRAGTLADGRAAPKWSGAKDSKKAVRFLRTRTSGGELWSCLSYLRLSAFIGGQILLFRALTYAQIKTGYGRR
jgi:hypothetical protein